MNPSMKTLARPDEVRSDGVDLDALDERAFEQLYARYAGQVRDVVRRHLWGIVVDDVVQETFAQAYRSGLHLDAHPDREAWVAKRLCGIARNRSIDVLRFRSRGLEEVPDDGRLLATAPCASAPDPDHHLLALHRREGIAEALEGLCGRQRRMLVMHYVDGRSYDEIAAVEGMSVEAVRSTLARGRRTFRQLYATIADRRGLSVVVGGWLSRLQARLREARDRTASALGNAAGTVTSAAPVVTNTLVAVTVVGGLAAGAMVSTMAPTETVQPIAAQASPAEGQEARDEGAGEHDDRDGRARSESEASSPPPSEPIPAEPPAAEPEVPAVAPTSASASANASVASDEAAPVDGVPGHAGADASTNTEADASEGTIEQEVVGDAEAVASIANARVDHTQEAEVGCIESQYADPVSDAACAALSPNG